MDEGRRHEGTQKRVRSELEILRALAPSRPRALDLSALDLGVRGPFGPRILKALVRGRQHGPGQS
jgi:hypothetical protein